MITIILLILKIIFYLVMIFIFYDFIVKLSENESTMKDKIYSVFKGLYKKIKESYEHFRQHFCKKSDKVNDDTGTVRNSSEIYDSSSEWQD